MAKLRGRRQKIGTTYVTRRKDGTFKTVVRIGRSLAADRRQRARKGKKKGYGHRYDYR